MTNAATREGQKGHGGPTTRSTARGGQQHTARVGNGTWMGWPKLEDGMMNEEQIETAIQDLTVRLSQIRARSHPATFERIWVHNIGRIEEIDEYWAAANDQNNNTSGAGNTAYVLNEDKMEITDAELAALNPADTISNMANSKSSSKMPEAGRSRDTAMAPRFSRNLSNEPFASEGPPVFSQHANLSLRVVYPTEMSVYLCSSPTADPMYADRSDHWVDAPVGPDEASRHAFFARLDRRLPFSAAKGDDVVGWAFSYGWEDVSRWMWKSTTEVGSHGEIVGGRAADGHQEEDKMTGKKETKKQKKKKNKMEHYPVALQASWQQLHHDIVRAARQGVGIFRMKVLVVVSQKAGGSSGRLG